MLVHGFAPAGNLHFRFTMPSVRSSLCWVVRLMSWPSSVLICDRERGPGAEVREVAVALVLVLAWHLRAVAQLL
jgi:hypothetical protein